jgi:hypothetical protein
MCRTMHNRIRHIIGNVIDDRPWFLSDLAIIWMRAMEDVKLLIIDPDLP